MVQSKPISVTHLVSALAAALLFAGIAASSEAHAGNNGTTCKSYHHHHCAQSANPDRSPVKGGNVGATLGGTADTGRNTMVRDHRAKGGYYAPIYPIVRDHRTNPVVRDHRNTVVVRDHRNEQRNEGRPHR